MTALASLGLMLAAGTLMFRFMRRSFERFELSHGGLPERRLFDRRGDHEPKVFLPERRKRNRRNEDEDEAR
jgi:hypothetical protein